MMLLTLSAAAILAMESKSDSSQTSIDQTAGSNAGDQRGSIDTGRVAESLYEFDAEPGDACGPPWLQAAGYSVWSSFFPVVSPRYGLAPTLGSLGSKPGWPGWTLHVSYNLKSFLPGAGLSIRFPALRLAGAAMGARFRILTADARREMELSLDLRPRKATPRLVDACLVVGLTVVRQGHLASVPAGAWARGRVTLATLGLQGSLGRTGHTWIETGLQLDHAYRSLGADFYFTKLTAGWTAGCRRAQTWFRFGAISGSAPPQYEFDLATDGVLLTSPAWSNSGKRLWSIGIEVNTPFVENLRGLIFATCGILDAPSSSAGEVGMGLAVPDASGGGWKLRLDAPWIRIDPRYDLTLDLRRWSFRVLLMIAPTEGPRAPLFDYRYAP